MRELTVVEIRVSVGEAPPLVVLAEVGGSGRRLPIWMSHGGASAIFGATEPVDADRPAIHDLAHQLLAVGQANLSSVRITRFEDGHFYAELVFAHEVLPARASDAIALALRAGCPIQCPEELLDAVGVAEAGAPAAPEPEEVERFLEFLDTVTPEDFGGDEQP